MFHYAVQIARRFWIFAIILFICNIVSCVSPSQLTYFQDVIKSVDSISKPYDIKPSSGDILYIVSNDLNPESAKVRNPFPPIPADPQSAPPSNAKGYLVNEEGNIDIPLIGSLFVGGKTTTEIAGIIQSKLACYLEKPTVIVRLANIRITVLGEVSKPGTLSYNYRGYTLPQALGLAGDLTPYARRDNILILRNEGNKQYSARIDLTKTDVLYSPFYYIHPNDVIYVSPNKARAASVDRTYQIVPILLTGITVVATILGIALK